MTFDLNHKHLLSLDQLTGAGIFISTVITGMKIVITNSQMLCHTALIKGILLFIEAI